MTQEKDLTGKNSEEMICDVSKNKEFIRMKFEELNQ